MESIKMKTGSRGSNEPNDNIKTFILIFMAIIWRRVWITTVIYCEHNKVNISKKIVLMALKFNTYSTAGIGNTLKPYITKAMIDGFLMPKFYEKNLYATRAVNLYKSGYEIVKKRNRYAEIKFLKDYAFKVFDIENKVMNDVAEESKDTLAAIERSVKSNNTDNSDDNSDLGSDVTSDTSDDNIEETIFITNGDKCYCKMCELVNSWDINENLIFSDDPFQNAIMKTLSSALEEENN